MTRFECESQSHISTVPMCTLQHALAHYYMKPCTHLNSSGFEKKKPPTPSNAAYWRLFRISHSVAQKTCIDSAIS